MAFGIGWDGVWVGPVGLQIFPRGMNFGSNLSEQYCTEGGVQHLL